MKSSKSFLQEFRQPSTSSLNVRCSQSPSESPIPRAFKEDSFDIHPSHTKPLSPIARICYPFLLSHLHNPYPTLAEKETLLKESGLPDISITNVSNWFANSRRRCGWIDICNEFFKGDTRSMVNACEWVLNHNMSDAVPHPPLSPTAIEAILSMRKRVRSWHEFQTDPSQWVVELYKLMESYSLEEKALMEDGYQILLGRKSSISPLLKSSPSMQLDANHGSLTKSKRKAEAIDSDDDGILNDDRLQSYPPTSYQSDDSDSQISRTPSLSWSNSTETADEDSELRPTKRLRSETLSPQPLIMPAFTNPGVQFTQGDDMLPAFDDITSNSSFTFSIPWDLQDQGFLQFQDCATTFDEQSTDSQSLLRKRAWADIDSPGSDINEPDLEQYTQKRRCLSNVTDLESTASTILQSVEISTSDYRDEHSTQSPSYSTPVTSSVISDYTTSSQEVSNITSSDVCLPIELFHETALLPGTSENITNSEVGQTEFEVFNWEHLLGFFCPETRDNEPVQADSEMFQNIYAQIAGGLDGMPLAEENSGSNSEEPDFVGPVVGPLEVPESMNTIREPSREIANSSDIQVLEDVQPTNLFLEELLSFPLSINQLFAE